MRQLHLKKAQISGAHDGPLPSWDRSSRGGGGVRGGEESRGIDEAALAINHLLGIAALGLVCVWCGNVRGGLLWNSPNKDLLFNFHPVLMIAGFVFVHGQANLTYRTLTGSRNYKKAIHFLAQGLALVLGAVGFLAALKFHNDRGIDNFYSLHSWLGLTTMTLFVTQWTVGFVSFWYPGGSTAARSSILPWHIFSGIFLYTLSLVTAETGLLEKLTFLQTSKAIERFGRESTLVNSLGLILVLLGFFHALALLTPKPPR
ncbi:hypothetical protein SELMODRAFT_109639 [Selaginella moellendorffii]|uniref:Cytochrome b561 domain-containing protein n=1 Tax=Selaginella moellendorffii TaxID=88036 RepID=D8S5N4_SELML|nr:probable transmembrane ascorbate ferrireductase 2 [Selaginella moellendorffii]EFJ20085.1 hypothetical protein SELMODRAFT_109639 [Selaginella moellendorffii]|eukprot:XP_002978638.1 probable transmembrane ascorbate ferrireductase 2 [Selaginella moellendorffii]